MPSDETNDQTNESSEKNGKIQVSDFNILENRGYKLLKKIGEGSYAKVYLAEYRSKTRKSRLPDIPEQGNSEIGNTSSGKSNAECETTSAYNSADLGTLENEDEEVIHLAAKIIGGTKKSPKNLYNKFLPRELAILSRIEHEYIIHVHSIFAHHKMVYIFMRYAENGDLLDFLLRYGELSEDQAKLWLRQLTLALSYLHGKGIVHRDIKCENVLITAKMNVKLSDFGFARMVAVPGNKRITKDDKITIHDGKKLYLCETYCGSLSYTAPEVLRGKPYNATISDLWSLGVILYIMLNESMPFDSTNVRLLYDQQVNKKWRFRSKIYPTLSDMVKKVVRGLLEPQCSSRWKISDIMKSEWFQSDPQLTYDMQMQEKKPEKQKPQKFHHMIEASTPRPSVDESAEPDVVEGITVICDVKHSVRNSIDHTNTWKVNIEAYNKWKKERDDLKNEKFWRIIVGHAWGLPVPPAGNIQNRKEINLSFSFILKLGVETGSSDFLVLQQWTDDYLVRRHSCIRKVSRGVIAIEELGNQAATGLRRRAEHIGTVNS
ncbi:hypothetical protein J437_LFUL013393 [Ladona fulva]|uniref:Protein kinase domain-containing protein n=1 Tax=Ladona fulva TaxID=123851 RepID=A0A8K0KGR6_LADFU|nr:hypothetical protein J437_LFUL013393 [Ladona fulva]